MLECILDLGTFREILTSFHHHVPHTHKHMRVHTQQKILTNQKGPVVSCLVLSTCQIRVEVISDEIEDLLTLLTEALPIIPFLLRIWVKLCLNFFPTKAYKTGLTQL